MTNEVVQLPPGQPALRLVAEPKDTNAAGDIFGGWIMSQVDIAGSLAASKRAKGRVVTVAVNSFHFKKPVYVGDVISCYAKIEKVGHTSITVFVEVYAERDPAKEGCIKVTSAEVTYVAVDDAGLPRAVN